MSDGVVVITAKPRDLVVVATTPDVEAAGRFVQKAVEMNPGETHPAKIVNLANSFYRFTNLPSGSFDRVSEKILNDPATFLPAAKADAERYVQRLLHGGYGGGAVMINTVTGEVKNYLAGAAGQTQFENGSSSIPSSARRSKRVVKRPVAPKKKPVCTCRRR